MNLELGETYSTRFTVTDAAGAPGAAIVTASATLPDGTTGAVSVATPSLGNYDIDYLGPQIGRYEIAISATGGVYGTLVRKRTDIINIDPVSSGSLIGLTDAKEHLNIPVADHDHDNELEGMLAVVSRFVESKTQYWHRTNVVEVFRRPAGAMLLTSRPVVAVTSVTIDGLVLDPTGYTVRADSGIVERPYYNYLLPGFNGEQAVVSYSVGAGYVPPDIRHAVKVVLAHLWRTQRGGSVMGAMGPDDVWDPRFSFSYPRAIREMLESYEPGPVFA